uniref:mucin-15 n=1 Tax=Semicossyphus pulcher TaxID=241346 RepID=UPI0037E81F00
MKLCLKITAGLLLLVQALHLASLQNSTDSPGRTIDPSWLREFAKNLAGSQNTAVSKEGKEYDQDAAAMESSNDYSGTASGYMVPLTEEEENVAGRNMDANEYNDMVVTTTVHPNETTKQPEFKNATVSPISATTDTPNASNINMTEAEDEFLNSTSTTTQPSTTHPMALNTTSSLEYSNKNDLNMTTLATEINATQEATTKPEEATGPINATESTSTTTVPTTTTPETSNTPTVFLSTTLEPSWTSETSPLTTTAAPLNASGNANNTDKASASGSNTERGLGSDPKRRRNSAWGTILGTAVAVACVGLVAFVILKHKHQKGFSHRKLVEEFPSDPVLRLDNNEPLDLNFGGSAYYNPALQGDNIQMSNFPGRR